MYIFHEKIAEQILNELEGGKIMKSFEYTITDPVGIHARPAGNLAKEAKQYEAVVTITKDGKSAEAKKLMALMALGVKQGDTVTVSVEGADEEVVAQKMEEAGCKEVPALKGKYLNHYAKNYLKLSSEEQNSEYGLELKERYKKEVSEMAGHYHINMTNRLLYLAMTTNPEFMGNILIQGRDNLYRLNRTIR